MDYSKQEFERLFKENYPHMYRMAFSMLENTDDAKDAVHQVFAQVWKGKPQIANDSIRGYVWRLPETNVYTCYAPGSFSDSWRKSCNERLLPARAKIAKNCFSNFSKSSTVT